MEEKLTIQERHDLIKETVDVQIKFNNLIKEIAQKLELNEKEKDELVGKIKSYETLNMVYAVDEFITNIENKRAF